MRPGKAQVTALAWAVFRCHPGPMRSMDFDDILAIRDATVASLERFGWIHRVKYYDDSKKWRWHWFYVTDRGRTLPEVQAEVARLRGQETARATDNENE